MGSGQAYDSDSTQDADEEALVFEEALVGDGFVLVGVRDDGHAEERDAHAAAVEPAQADGYVFLGAGNEGFVEGVEGRVWAVVRADEGGEGGGGEYEGHYEGEVDGEPCHC